MLFFRPYFQFTEVNWIEIVVAIMDCCSGGISYDTLMAMDICRLSMIYDVLCRRQAKMNRDIQKAK